MCVDCESVLVQNLFDAVQYPPPSSNDDGTITATIVSSTASAHGTHLLSVLMPAGLARGSPPGAGFGQYFLVRCAEPGDLDDWQIYFRRAAFPVRWEVALERESLNLWQLLISGEGDPGVDWLVARNTGQQINVSGPFGNPQAIPNNSQNLLLLSDPARALTFLPLIQTALDRSGRVTLITSPSSPLEHMTRHMPLAVEIRTATTFLEVDEHLAQTLRWADRMYAQLPVGSFQHLADLVNLHRFALEPGFAYVVACEDLYCGIGACLACVVPSAKGGYTRACIHGPVFDLTRLTS